LNTEGGSIYFGIEDNGTIKGVELGRKERDDLRLGIDNVVNRYTPQVYLSLVLNIIHFIYLCMLG
jgi:predicted HTH transcriptional regulator